MTKRISPAILAILLILIVIFIIFVFVPLAHVSLTLVTRASNQIEIEEEISKCQQLKRVVIDQVSGNAITLRNIGTYPVAHSELSVFVNDAVTSIACGAIDKIDPGSVAICTLGASCDIGGKVRVVSPGLIYEVTC